MKVGVIIAILAVAVIVAVASFFSYVMLALIKAFSEDIDEISNRDALELENSEYDYGHNIRHDAYGE